MTQRPLTLLTGSIVVTGVLDQADGLHLCYGDPTTNNLKYADLGISPIRRRVYLLMTLR